MFYAKFEHRHRKEKRINFQAGECCSDCTVLLKGSTGGKSDNPNRAEQGSYLEVQCAGEHLRWEASASTSREYRGDNGLNWKVKRFYLSKVLKEIVSRYSCSDLLPVVVHTV